MVFGERNEGDGVLTDEDSGWIWLEGWRARNEVSFRLEIGHFE